MMVAALLAGGAAGAARAEGGVAVVGLDDLDLGRWTGRGDLVADDVHCVGVRPRHGPPRFNLEATGDGPGGAFELTNGVSRLPFSVRYDDGTGLRELRAGQLLAQLKGAPDTPGLRRCLRGDPAARHRIEILVHERDLARVTAGRFRGRIQLTIASE
jgi:hypothetical protein